jgi:hypothetical protein
MPTPKKRNYLLLLSLSATNAVAGKAVLAAINKSVDANARPLWLDSKGAGIFIESNQPAVDIWDQCIPNTPDCKDALIVEIGPDWIGRIDAKPTHWLKTHLGDPLRSDIPKIRGR